MRLAVLTTDTTHHTWWVWQLAEAGVLAGVFLERRAPKPGYETGHPSEAERDEYERDVLLATCPGSIESFAPTVVTDAVNDAAAIDALRSLAPELTVVFGTGLVGAGAVDAAGGPMLNLHGGNPELYRGLDTHLWAIYHRDFSNLITTLHVLAPELDTGAIVAQDQIRLDRGTRFHELRALNTRICLELTLGAAAALERFGRHPSRDQVSRGRYYSAMPSALKDQCVRRFEEHVAAL